MTRLLMPCWRVAAIERWAFCSLLTACCVMDDGDVVLEALLCIMRSHSPWQALWGEAPHNNLHYRIMAVDLAAVR